MLFAREDGIEPLRPRCLVCCIVGKGRKVPDVHRQARSHGQILFYNAGQVLIAPSEASYIDVQRTKITVSSDPFVRGASIKVAE